MDLLNHIYWKKKAAFALAEDIYDAWVVFAVEEGVFRYDIGGRPERRVSLIWCCVHPTCLFAE